MDVKAPTEQKRDEVVAAILPLGRSESLKERFANCQTKREAQLLMRRVRRELGFTGKKR